MSHSARRRLYSWYEHVIDRVDVFFRRAASMFCAPGLRNARQREDRRNMRTLGHAHWAPRLFDRNFDAEFAESLDKSAHRRERAIVHDSARPIKDDGLQDR